VSPGHPFTDENGRGWTVHDFSVIGGKIQRFPVGDLAAQYRGFAPLDGGARWRYVFKTGDPHAPLPRELEGQLRLSQLDWRDDPKHYETLRQAGFTNPGQPERVDPES
jgi:hypothetical protein